MKHTNEINNDGWRSHRQVIRPIRGNRYEMIPVLDVEQVPDVEGMEAGEAWAFQHDYEPVLRLPKVKRQSERCIESQEVEILDGGDSETEAGGQEYESEGRSSELKEAGFLAGTGYGQRDTRSAGDGNREPAPRGGSLLPGGPAAGNADEDQEQGPTDGVKSVSGGRAQ